MNAKERLFVYGTLRNPDVQKKLFGRIVAGISDVLVGYRMSEIVIVGETYPLSVEDPGSAINGLVVDLTPEELEAADDYETSAYRRVNLVLKSGTTAWIYLKTPAE